MFGRKIRYRIEKIAFDKVSTKNRSMLSPRYSYTKVAAYVLVAYKKGNWFFPEEEVSREKKLAYFIDVARMHYITFWDRYLYDKKDVRDDLVVFADIWCDLDGNELPSYESYLLSKENSKRRKDELDIDSPAKRQRDAEFIKEQLKEKYDCDLVVKC